MNQFKQTQIEASDNQPANHKKAIWKKPQVKRLRISLDTAFFTGSNADGTRSTP